MAKKNIIFFSHILFTEVFMRAYYALVKNTESEEYHLRSYRKVVNDATKEVKYKSISDCSECGEFIDEKFTGALLKEHVDGKKYTYYDEGGMRFLCAKVGRKVCGKCVATLYTTH